MIEVEVPVPCDMTLTSIEDGINRLRKHYPSGRVFFIAFTSQHRIFSRATETSLAHGYDAVFMQPNEKIPNDYAWDLVMYSNETGEPIARIQQRPS